MNARVSEYVEPPVRGYLHRPEQPNGDGLVLTHGAGGNANAPLLVKVAGAFAATGTTVLRFDLPFRQKRPHGPPSNSSAADQANIQAAASQMRKRLGGKIFIGGQSYGGRQASMSATEDTTCASALLLLSYPLHPPGKTNLRTSHFPEIRIPVLFVQGARDPFGGPEEIESAKIEIPAPTTVSTIANAGHDLKGGRFEIEELVILPFQQLLSR